MQQATRQPVRRHERAAAHACRPAWTRLPRPTTPHRLPSSIVSARIGDTASCRGQHRSPSPVTASRYCRRRWPSGRGVYRWWTRRGAARTGTHDWTYPVARPAFRASREHPQPRHRRQRQCRSRLSPAFRWWSTVPARLSCPCSIWLGDARIPASPSDPDVAVELGVKFRTDVNGYHHRPPLLQESSGCRPRTSATCGRVRATLLASRDVRRRDRLGLAGRRRSPAPIAYRGEHHLRSVLSHDRRATTRPAADSFATSGVDNGPLHALPDGVDGPTASTATGRPPRSLNQSFLGDQLLGRRGVLWRPPSRPIRRRPIGKRDFASSWRRRRVSCRRAGRHHLQRNLSAASTVNRIHVRAPRRGPQTCLIAGRPSTYYGGERGPRVYADDSSLAYARRSTHARRAQEVQAAFETSPAMPLVADFTWTFTHGCRTATAPFRGAGRADPGHQPQPAIRSAATTPRSCEPKG